MRFLSNSIELEHLIKNTLPKGKNYDDWTVLVGRHRVKAYTLYTGYNKNGNKKYANFCVSFEIANPANVQVDYTDNSIDVREWIEDNGIDNLVYEDIVAELPRIYGELAKYIEG